jgi:tryptophan synthase alpha chain
VKYSRTINNIRMKNRIIELFENKKENILNIYFTAGFPDLQDTVKVLKALENSGVDMVEIGMPYSDPTADGPTIQDSSEKALANGMTIHKLFEQLEGIREHVSIPIVLMGYINPVMQYGITEFCEKAGELGIDGTILPDLPFDIYDRELKEVFEKNNISNVFLVTPQTSEERIKELDKTTKGFVYIVSTNSTTGSETKVASDMNDYLRRIKNTSLENPTLIGFNIKDKQSFNNACQYANGAIIGSAFVKMLNTSNNIEKDIDTFVKKIKG